SNEKRDLSFNSNDLKVELENQRTTCSRRGAPSETLLKAKNCELKNNQEIVDKMDAGFEGITWATILLRNTSNILTKTLDEKIQK
ncbi:3099_t:CDS:2, partial [Scutellospora calospora]